jgi:acyl-coenzyme A thioesterase PaaI-like protein
MERLPTDAGGPESRRASVTVTARNPATQSQNDIHADGGAQRMGFAAGLVPGSAIYSYLVAAAEQLLGSTWQHRTAARIRYLAPVYEGDEILAEALAKQDDPLAGFEVTVTKTGSERPVAVGWAGGLPDSDLPPSAGDYPALPLPSQPIPFTESEVLDQPGLGSVEVVVTEADVRDYLLGIGLPPESAHGVAPSAYLARMYVPVVESNLVQQGPGIHVGTALKHYRPVAFGERLSVRARVDRLFGRRGSRYRVLGLAWVADNGEVVMTSEHTGIYHVRPGIGVKSADRQQPAA